LYGQRVWRTDGQIERRDDDDDDDVNIVRVLPLTLFTINWDMAEFVPYGHLLK
jgi:hypothetical protein